MTILTAHARIAGVAGWPVQHSRSPLLHNHWLARYEIDGAYVPLPIAPVDFAGAVHGLRACGFAGLNVTLPHKEAAYALCDAVDDAARQAGAVNTIMFQGGLIMGRNTDGYGFVENLRAHGVDPVSGPALILGAGGAARAVAAALLACGVPVSLSNRTLGRAAALATALPGVRVIDWDRRNAAVADHGLIVNTTALGMGDGALPADLANAASGTVVADIVYVPLQTPLLAAARARELRTVGGLGMLLHQARPGFAAWFGREPVVDAETLDLMARDILPA